MNKPFHTTEIWKLLRTILEIVALVGALLLLGWIVNVISMETAVADEPLYECWVFCNPESEVMIRSKPSRKSEIVGTAVCGNRYRTEWTEKNGYVHVSDVGNESGEGWISARYIAASEPRMTDYTVIVKAKGRVAVREYPDGKRKRWVYPDTELRVYCIADGWAVTEIGYIMTSFLEAD